MNNQEIFDKVAAHLLTQRKQALNSSRECRYNIRGLKCAIGCLIPNYLYDKRIEGATVTQVAMPLDTGSVILADILAGLEIDLNAQSRLLQVLQTIHDEEDVASWTNTLLNVAAEYNLNPSVAMAYALGIEE